MWKHNFRGRTLVFAVTACSCQAFLLLGYDQGVMSGLVGADNRFGRDFNNPNVDMQGNIVALYDVRQYLHCQKIATDKLDWLHFRLDPCILCGRKIRSSVDAHGWGLNNGDRFNYPSYFNDDCPVDCRKNCNWNRWFHSCLLKF